MSIENEIRENRRDTRRLTTAFREPPRTQTNVLAFAAVAITVDVTARVYTRPLNDTLVFGHPDASQGIGRGAIGDNRGDWTQQATASETAFVDGGRGAVAEALAGIARGVGFGRVGSDGSTPTDSDASLGAGKDLVHAWGVPGAETTTGVAGFRFSEVTDTVAEVGLHSDEQALMARATLSAIDPTATQEVRIEVDLAFSEDTVGSNAVTGLGTIADAIASPGANAGIAELALGTDGTDPTTSDTVLGNEVIRRQTRGEARETTTTASTLFFRSEPATQPHEIRELGAFAGDGTMLWRLTFAAETKDDLIRMKPVTRAEVV